MSTLRRAPFIDEYVEGDRSVVMLEDGRVMAVAPVVTEILRVLGEKPRSMRDLLGSLVQTFEKTNDAQDRAVLEQSVRFVIAQGLVVSAVT